MTFRVLDSSEWGDLAHEFEARGIAMPDPQSAFIVGSFKHTGELSGFMVCQAQVHAEPLVLYDPRALRGLVRCLEAELMKRTGTVRYYAFTNDRVSGMAQALGLQKLPFEVFERSA